MLIVQIENDTIPILITTSRCSTFIVMYECKSIVHVLWECPACNT